MKITKKNGTISVYDDERVIRSILRANAEVDEEQLSEREAAALADAVFARVTAGSEMISTADVRECVYAILRERGLPMTAERYMSYGK